VRQRGLDHQIRLAVSLAALVGTLLLALLSTPVPELPSMQAVDVPALKAKKLIGLGSHGRPLGLPRDRGSGPSMGAWSWRRRKAAAKLHPLPFHDGPPRIAALGFKIEVHCSSCYRQTKLDPADRRVSDRVFASTPFRCSGNARPRAFAVPLQPCRAPGLVYIKPAGAPALLAER